MGDFNHIVTTNLDKFSVSSTTVHKKLPLYNWLSSQKFVDAFCYLNPNTQTYTWTNGSTATWIDQIWISEGLIKNLYIAEILEIYLITERDHSTVLINLKNESNIQNYA